MHVRVPKQFARADTAKVAAEVLAVALIVTTIVSAVVGYAAQGSV